MVVSMPRKGIVRTDAADMVRVQLKENDIRSYRRADAETIVSQTPGAYIMGEQPADAVEDAEPNVKARGAANKARAAKPAEPKAE